MYNLLFKNLTANEILYKKQFEFQKGYSTKHLIIQLIDPVIDQAKVLKQIILRSLY